MTRRSPLTPIFDEEPQRGSIAVGNTPGWTPPMIDPTGASVTVTPGTLTVDMAIPVTGATVAVTPGTLVLSDALATAILALGPYLYWQRNEASGTTAVDSSPNGRDGTYTSATLQNVLGDDGVYYAEGGTYYATTDLRLTTNSPITVIVLNRRETGDSTGSIFAAQATADVPQPGTGSDWMSNPQDSSGNWTARCETVRTTSTTWRGHWDFGANEIVADEWTMLGQVFYNGTTNPKRYRNGTLLGGSNINGTGTQRFISNYISVGKRSAHFAVFTSELLAADMSDLAAAAASAGWTLS